MPIDLEVIAARAEAAQKGPWFVGYEDGSGATCGKEGACITALPDIPEAAEVGRLAIVMGLDADGCSAGVLVQPDAEFIAAARTDVPVLIGAVRRAQLALVAIAHETPHVPDDWCAHCYATEAIRRG